MMNEVRNEKEFVGTCPFCGSECEKGEDDMGFPAILCPATDCQALVVFQGDLLKYTREGSLDYTEAVKHFNKRCPADATQTPCSTLPGNMARAVEALLYGESVERCTCRGNPLSACLKCNIRKAINVINRGFGTEERAGLADKDQEGHLKLVIQLGTLITTWNAHADLLAEVHPNSPSNAAFRRCASDLGRLINGTPAPDGGG